jgi:hypothetical protein
MRTPQSAMKQRVRIALVKAGLVRKPWNANKTDSGSKSRLTALPVLKMGIPGIHSAVRVPQPPSLPVVLSREETEAVTASLSHSFCYFANLLRERSGVSLVDANKNSQRPVQPIIT